MHSDLLEIVKEMYAQPSIGDKRGCYMSDILVPKELIEKWTAALLSHFESCPGRETTKKEDG